MIGEEMACSSSGPEQSTSTATNVVSSSNSEERAFSGLDEEDSYYCLKILERDAFVAIVNAFRAQGVCSPYKQTLLKHLKSALSISDAIYHAEFRKAANNKILAEIATILNPSYDIHSQWEMIGMDVVPPATNIPLFESSEIKGTQVADALLRLANDHNSALKDEMDALHDLIGLPETRYVPERLRLILNETEKNCDSSVGLPQNVRAKKSLPNNAKHAVSGKKASRIEQKRETKAATEDITLKIHHPYRERRTSSTRIITLASPSEDDVRKVSANPRSSSANNGCSSSQSAAVPESNVNSPEATDTRKRKLKQRDAATLTCARVQPFIFEPVSAGQKSKPVRGNPDRRAPKQSVSLPGPSVAVATAPCNVSSDATSTNFSQPSSLPTSYNVLSAPSMAAKRSRTTSNSETNVPTEGISLHPRPVNASLGAYKLQPPASRSFVRTGHPVRYYASPLVSAYSSPTRPYYGNPNAAAVGVMRSIGHGTYSITTANSSPSSSAVNSSARVLSHSDFERLVAQNSGAATAGTASFPMQYRAIRRTPVISRSRINCLPVRFATTALPVSSPTNLTNNPSANAYSSTTFRFAHSSPTLRPNSVHAQIGTVAVASSVQNSNGKEDEEVEQNSSTSSSRRISGESITTNDVSNPQSEDSGVRLECDEIMMPEQNHSLSSRNVASTSSHIDATMARIAQLPPRTVQEMPMLVEYDDDSRKNNHADITQAQYTNGLRHQDGQNAINYVTASHCIR